jgi:hypothetical protein
VHPNKYFHYSFQINKKILHILLRQ